MATLERIVIGRNTHVDFGKRAAGVPAKIDTGADGSAVWASNIRVDKNGVLKFSLFGEQNFSPNRLFGGNGKERFRA